MGLQGILLMLLSCTSGTFLSGLCPHRHSPRRWHPQRSTWRARCSSKAAAVAAAGAGTLGSMEDWKERRRRRQRPMWRKAIQVKGGWRKGCAKPGARPEAAAAAAPAPRGGGLEAAWPAVCGCPQQQKKQRVTCSSAQWRLGASLARGTPHATRGMSRDASVWRRSKTPSAWLYGHSGCGCCMYICNGVLG